MRYWKFNDRGISADYLNTVNDNIGVYNTPICTPFPSFHKWNFGFDTGGFSQYYQYFYIASKYGRYYYTPSTEIYIVNDYYGRRFIIVQPTGSVGLWGVVDGNEKYGIGL